MSRSRETKHLRIKKYEDYSCDQLILADEQFCLCNMIHYVAQT